MPLFLHSCQAFGDNCDRRQTPLPHVVVDKDQSVSHNYFQTSKLSVKLPWSPTVLHSCRNRKAEEQFLPSGQKDLKFSVLCTEIFNCCGGGIKAVISAGSQASGFLYRISTRTQVRQKQAHFSSLNSFENIHLYHPDMHKCDPLTVKPLFSNFYNTCLLCSVQGFCSHFCFFFTFVSVLFFLFFLSSSFSNGDDVSTYWNKDFQMAVRMVMKFVLFSKQLLVFMD